LGHRFGLGTGHSPTGLIAQFKKLETGHWDTGTIETIETGQGTHKAWGQGNTRGRTPETLGKAARMGEEGLSTPNLATATIAHELMEEDLQRELARNEAATRMAREREAEARAAKKRAEESQHLMNAMLAKYEEMRNKLDSTKQHLDETNSKISNQAALTDKISAMKERIETYATKKEAVTALTEHVKMRNEIQQKQLEVVSEGIEEEDDDSIRIANVKVGLREHAERMETLKANLKKNEETNAKREQLKAMLERQVELEEKRTAEQNKIAERREKLLELKLKELQLQKARLERTKKEQEEKRRATNDFMASIESQLEDMEAKAKAPVQAELNKQMGAVPKQGKGKGKGKKSKSNTPKVMSPEPKTPKVMSPEPSTEKVKSPEPKSSKVMSPEPPEKGQIDAAMAKSERRQAIIQKMEQMEKAKTEKEENKLSAEEIKDMVAKVEGKCKTVSGDIADMAMSEQYLRTKQALLMAKKKEQEMAIATNIAKIREDEVKKMRDKVAAMQELLNSRKQKLKITEEILVEKVEEKKNMDKDMEKIKRRENYVEKELMDRVVFEKDPPKKK